MSLVSHRGAAGIAHENSIEAITRAETFQPVYIETDIHCTSDMVFVMYHGNLRQTLTGNNIPLTYLELKEKIPTIVKLEDLLENKSITTAYMFDIKCADVIDDLVAYLKQQGLPSSVGFTSPHARALVKLKEAFPHSITLISQPYQEGPIKAIEYARDYGFSGISLNKWWLGPLPYFLCKRYKKQLMVYTIDHSVWIWLAQTFFPAIMLCTNHPERYRKLFPLQIKK